MVGQKQLQSRIEQLIENGTFPRFSILVGPKRSGKKLLAHDIAKKIPDALVFDVGISVSDVRATVENSYKMVNTVVRIIPDADNMSNAAKNALLKVTEEPPNNAYFIMTLEDESNTLETIRSRGTIFHMDRYTPLEIYEAYENRVGVSKANPDEGSIVCSLCDTPGDVDILIGMNVKEFYDYVQLVVDNISDVQLANSFKIPSKVALKDDAEGYDLKLFWKAFIKVCMERSFDDIEDKFEEAEHTTRMILAAQITSGYLSSLRVKGINKQMLIDNWIISIRSI